MESPRSPPAREPSPMKVEETQEERPAPEQVEAPAKRQRTAASKTEDRARGKRMFGNLLGTLRKFQDDDKSSRTSEAAKRREQTASRIADKLRAEHAAMDNLQMAERELRSLRLATENAAYMLEHKELALTSRHASLRASKQYLATSTTPRSSPASLYPTPPVPLALPPSNSKTTPPLYFKPKVLTQKQEEELTARNEEIDKLIAEEEAALATERVEVREAAERNKIKIGELAEKVESLRSELGDRAPRRERVEEEREFVVKGDGDDMDVEY